MLTVEEMARLGKEKFRKLVEAEGVKIETKDDEMVFDLYWGFFELLLKQWGDPKKIDKWLKEHNR
jgi:hypothetical protein